jgi:hypothetical protein
MLSSKSFRGKLEDRETYGIDLQLLKSWSAERTQQLLSSEEAKQEIAVQRARRFIDAVG